jgi:hypothetical protein
MLPSQVYPPFWDTVFSTNQSAEENAQFIWTPKVHEAFMGIKQALA